MAALTKSRATVQVGDHATIELVQFPIKGSTKIYAGAGVVSNAGYADNAAAATGLVTLGVLWRVVPPASIAQPPSILLPAGDADNSSGADGAFWVEVRRGTFKFKNGTGGDAVTQAALPLPVYWLDNQTVSVVSTGHSIAGMAWFIDPDDGQVAVELGIRSATGV